MPFQKKEFENTVCIALRASTWKSEHLLRASYSPDRRGWPGPGPGETEGSVEWHSPPPASQQVTQHVTLFRAQSDAQSNASLKLDLRSTQSSLLFLFIERCVCLSLTIKDNKKFENSCELLSISIKTWQCPDVKRPIKTLQDDWQIWLRVGLFGFVVGWVGFRVGMS